MKMLRGGTEIFSGIKGGALKFLDIPEGGGGALKTFQSFGPDSSGGLDSHQHLFFYFTPTLS